MNTQAHLQPQGVSSARATTKGALRCGPTLFPVSASPEADEAAAKREEGFVDLVATAFGIPLSLTTDAEAFVVSEGVPPFGSSS
jgi:hypothetical protein